MKQNIYGSLKLFKFSKKISEIQSNKITPPIHVRIKPTNICNHSCWFCAYRVDNLELGKGMNLKDQISKNKMSEIVNDLISMKVKAVTFSGGGEPLLYEHICSSIKKLSGADIKVGIITNGSFLENEVAEVVAKEATWVRVSMDYFDEKSLRKSRKSRVGEFDRIILNMKNFASMNSNCSLGVSFVITNDNSSNIFEIVSLLKDIGVEHVKLSGVVTDSDGEKSNEYHKENHLLINKQIEKCVSLESDEFKIINHYHNLSSCFKKSYLSCPSAQLLTIIGADESVYACQDKAYSESGLLGSISKMSFKEFWQSRINRQRLLGLNPSKDCDHHCVSNMKNETMIDFMNLNEEHAQFV